MKRFILTVVAVLAAAAAVVAGENPVSAPVQAAKALFERYVTLEQQFDPLVADLYSDAAVIKNKRTYPTGQVREMTLPAPQYKDLIRTAMPVAKLRGDTSSDSDGPYAEEGARVRITSHRFSNLKKYTSPISLLVGPTATGWLIFEELSESQP